MLDRALAKLLFKNATSTTKAGSLGYTPPPPVRPYRCKDCRTSAGVSLCLPAMHCEGRKNHHDVTVRAREKKSRSIALRFRFSAIPWRKYPTSIKVTNREMKGLRIERDDFHGDSRPGRASRHDRPSHFLAPPNCEKMPGPHQWL